MTDIVSEYWDSFYEKFHFNIPSQFATFVASDIPDNSVVIDLACGNGRDSHFFSSLGHRVVAYDKSQTVINKNMNGSMLGVSGKPLFHQLDVCAYSDAIAAINTYLSNESNACNVIAYSRFFIHTITEDQEQSFLNILAHVFPSGSRCYFEFRTIENAQQPKLYGNHYRRYISTSNFCDTLVSTGYFKLEYVVEGLGMAKFREEDPHVARVILSRTDKAFVACES
jgi:SAM-dependent methyltransferase